MTLWAGAAKSAAGQQSRGTRAAQTELGTHSEEERIGREGRKGCRGMLHEPAAFPLWVSMN